MSNTVKIKRGRSSRKVGNVVRRFKPSTMKMDDFKFNPELFVPMKTDTKIDNLLSSEGGMMKGTNVAFVGDIVSEWIIKGAMITDASFGDYSWDDVDAAQELTMTVQPDYCVLNF